MHASKADLKSLQTLKKHADFLNINAKGKKWVSHGLVLQVLKNDLDVRRVGYTVTKRTEKSAVKRNRIKRRLRAAAADILPGFAKPGYDYVLIGRNQTALRPYEQLCEDIKWCLGKLECLEK